MGFDWSSVEGVFSKIDEELSEVRQAVEEQNEDAMAEEIGDLLFSVVNLARFSGFEAEELLRLNVDKFSRRFAQMEERAAQQHRAVQELDLDELNALWNRVKNEER